MFILVHIRCSKLDNLIRRVIFFQLKSTWTLRIVTTLGTIEEYLLTNSPVNTWWCSG